MKAAEKKVTAQPTSPTVIAVAEIALARAWATTCIDAKLTTQICECSRHVTSPTWSQILCTGSRDSNGRQEGGCIKKKELEGVHSTMPQEIEELKAALMEAAATHSIKKKELEGVQNTMPQEIEELKAALEEAAATHSIKKKELPHASGTPKQGGMKQDSMNLP